METPGITLRQAFWLFVNSRFIITLVFIPYFTDIPNNQDVIPALLVHLLMNLLYASVFITLWLQYPKYTLIEYSNAILGRFMGKFIGMLYIWYFIHDASVTLRIFDEFMSARFLTRTPIEVITIGILLVVAYVVYTGLENLGRCAEVLVPYIFIGILILTALALPQADVRSVMPTLEHGIPPLLWGSISSTTRWAELAWMAMIIPFIVNLQKIKLAIYGGILFNNIIWLLLLGVIVAIYGPEIIMNIQFPTYAMVEVIQIGGFLERIESLVLGLWVFGAFLKLGIFYYVAVLGASQWFGLQDKKPLILPIGFLIYFLSLLLFNNIVELRAFGGSRVPYDFTFVFVIPCIMLIIHFVKKRFLRQSQEGY